jgi:TldD protein
VKSWFAISLLGIATAVALTCAAGTDKDTAETRQDSQLRAMSDEINRSKTLKLNDLDKPYFIQYSSDDAEQMAISASLGGLTHSERFHLRRPSAVVRVGSYAFDNTNSIYSAIGRLGLFPLDDDYQVMRTSLWQSTDALYKAATGQITAKRNALREISEPDKTPDLAPAKAVHILDPVLRAEVDLQAWEGLARNVSAGFVSHPAVLNSSVRVQIISSTYRLVNSEGTVVRIPETLNEIQIRASSKAADGQPVWNHEFFVAPRPSGFPKKEELTKAVDLVAAQTETLTKAPLGEDYTGPVLFEQEAAAQMMAEVLADAVALRRKPLAPPGSNERARMLDSVWISRTGSKVAPDWLSVFDDPLQKTYGGKTLAGYYRVDDEGVPAQRVQLIDKGTLRGFLSSRLPVRNVNGSNGHGRLPGGFGSEAAVLGNLFVEAAQRVPEAQLKATLIEKVKSAGLQYGLIIKRLDFPSTATLTDLQSMAVQLRNSGAARTLDPPLLAYRVFPDGREELVRGLRFREFSAKDLRDLDAASDQPYVFNYVNDGSSLNIADLRSEATTSSVVCPSLLLDSVELTRAENEAGAPPVVPPPSLVAGQ